MNVQFVQSNPSSTKGDHTGASIAGRAGAQGIGATGASKWAGATPALAFHRRVLTATTMKVVAVLSGRREASSAAHSSSLRAVFRVAAGITRELSGSSQA